MSDIRTSSSSDLSISEVIRRGQETAFACSRYVSVESVCSFERFSRVSGSAASIENISQMIMVSIVLSIYLAGS